MAAENLDQGAPIIEVSPPSGTAGEVFRAFLKLGLTSFGGPIAHLGFFRNELVVRRGWVDETEFADLVALCQFLPGPASSQVGFALGLIRAGPLGALAAWTAFTLPSAILMTLIALMPGAMGSDVGGHLVHGLKLVAVAVVAQAVWGMAQTLTPDKERASIAVVAILVVSLLAGSAGQVIALVLGSLAGMVLGVDDTPAARNVTPLPVTRSAGRVATAVFILLLIAPPLLQAGTHQSGWTLFNAFYRSGALVFGGGHVVLPLLQAAVVQPGWIDPDRFLSGYGAAQAMPGPLFTFAAYLGATVTIGPGGVAGAALALIAIFLPGLLILVAVLPFWGAVRERPMVRAAMRGANAAVVGILATALYSPVWTSAIFGPRDFATAAVGFVLLVGWKAPPWLIVVLLPVIATALQHVGSG